MDQKQPVNAKDVEENKIIAALSYISVLSLVVLLIKRDSPFAQFHAKQGLVLFIVEVLGWLVYLIPFFGWILMVIFIFFSLLGFWNAYQGRWWNMPLASAFAKKINL